MLKQAIAAGYREQGALGLHFVQSEHSSVTNTGSGGLVFDTRRGDSVTTLGQGRSQRYHSHRAPVRFLSGPSCSSSSSSSHTAAAVVVVVRAVFVCQSVALRENWVCSYHGYCGPALMELMEQITDEADPFSDYLASPPSASLVHCTWPNTFFFFFVALLETFGDWFLFSFHKPFVKQHWWPRGRRTDSLACRSCGATTAAAGSPLRAGCKRTSTWSRSWCNAALCAQGRPCMCPSRRRHSPPPLRPSPWSASRSTSDLCTRYLCCVVCVCGCRAACVVYHIVKEGTLTPTAAGASQHEGGGRRDCGSATGAVTGGCCWV